MTTARDIMTEGCRCVGEHDTVAEAARVMRDERVGSLPICGDDRRLKGMITDRDIVVGAVAEGADPGATEVTRIATGGIVYVDAESDAREVKEIMARNKVRRVPVIEDRELVGIVSVSDFAATLGAQDAGELLGAIGH